MRPPRRRRRPPRTAPAVAPLLLPALGLVFLALGATFARAEDDGTEEALEVPLDEDSEESFDEMDDGLLDVPDDDPLDDPIHDEPIDQPSSLAVEGSARAGWRFLSGRGRGRFLQDVDLDNGFRLFDLDVRITDDAEDATFDEFTATSHDVGERSTDAQVSLRRRNELLIEGGYFRDLFTYRADGDPFPRDTTRERSSARVRFTPRRGLAFRFAWDRSERRGESLASMDTDLRESPPPAGVDPDIVQTRRPFDETFDTFTLGSDVTSGLWRFGLTASLRHGRVNDERTFFVPRDRRGSDPVQETFERDTDSQATTLVGKVGRTFLDGAVESTLFVTHTQQPVDSDLSGTAEGVDNAFEGGLARGAFTSRSEGETDIDRSVRGWELDTVWQATDDLEITVTGGHEEFVDDADFLLVEERRYDRPDVGRRTLVSSKEGRTTVRVVRLAVEGAYDVSDDVVLRAGYERFEQDVKAPFETEGDSLDGATLASTVERFMGGIDIRPAKRLKVSVLARRARDDDPPAAPSAETADEVTARVRWRDDEGFAIAGVYRYRGFHQNAEFDSSTRSESASLSGSWTNDAWNVQASVTRQTLDTATGTSFFVLDASGFRQLDEDVAYQTRDLILSLHAEYEVTQRLRVRTTGTYLRSRGEEELDSHEVSATCAYDLYEQVTVGLTARAWRYDERDRSVDDYDADALEVWLEYLF